MNAIDPKLVGYSVAELQTMAAMAQDVVDEGGPFATAMAELVAQYTSTIAIMTGSNVQTAPQVDDGVRVGREAGSPTSNQYGTFAVYAASEKQVAFLQRLVDEKITDGVKIPSTLQGISKTAASALIDKLIDRPSKTAAPVRLASEKQVALIKKLLGEKDLTGTAFTVWDDELLAVLQMSEASPAIDMLFALPRKPVQLQAEIAAGAYRVGEKIVRVYLGQQSGRMLAAELVDITAENRDDAWNYLGAAGRFVPTDAHRLTVEECEQIAGASGQSFSWCCVCGRRLDDPNSVSRGIGPVCRAKQG